MFLSHAAPRHLPFHDSSAHRGHGCPSRSTHDCLCSVRSVFTDLGGVRALMRCFPPSLSARNGFPEKCTYLQSSVTCSGRMVHQNRLTALTAYYILQSVFCHCCSMWPLSQLPSCALLYRPEGYKFYHLFANCPV